MLKLKFVAYCCLLLLTVACNKEEQKIREVLPSHAHENASSNSRSSSSHTPVVTTEGAYEMTSYFFLDEAPVAPYTYEVDDSSLYIITEVLDDGDGDTLTTLTHTHAFTHEVDYYAFARELGGNLGLYEGIAAHLQEYIVENGYDIAWDTTGVIPPTYLDYQATYTDSVLSARNSARGLLTFIHKSLDGGPTWALFPLFNPWMPPGYNNRVESFTPMFIGGWHLVYDRSCFRRRMHTFFMWYPERVMFAGPFRALRDRASSWMKFGI